MTYDDWKTRDDFYGEDADGETRGTCDICERQHVIVSQCWASGIETWACDECRGIEPEDDDIERYEADK